MDQVCEIARQPGCAVVRFTSGEKLTVPLPLLRERPLKAGQEASPAEYRLFMRLRGYPHALDAAVRLLAACDRSEHEVRARLSRAGYPQLCVERVIEKLYAEELLDDAAFAERWAQSRAHRHGRERIRRELAQRGVDPETAAAATSRLSDEDQLADAVRLTGKFLGRTHGAMDRKLYQRTLAMLARHGYGPDVARRALEVIAKGEDAAEEPPDLYYHP